MTRERGAGDGRGGGGGRWRGRVVTLQADGAVEYFALLANLRGKKIVDETSLDP